MKLGLSDKFMDQNLKDIITRKSGHNLHFKTVKILEENGWKTELNTYYLDDTTDKPREIDIIATKSLNPGKHVFDCIFFIECKRFNNEIAFRSHKVRPGETIEAFNMTKINKGEIIEFLQARQLTSFEDTFHYLNYSSVARLHDSHKDEQNNIFNALTQPIKSLIFFRERSKNPTFLYPLAVYNGINGIYDIPAGYDLVRLDELSLEKILPYGINYSYKTNEQPLSEVFFIDFIHFDSFQDYISLIHDEMSMVQKYFMHREDEERFNGRTKSRIRY